VINPPLTPLLERLPAEQVSKVSEMASKVSQMVRKVEAPKRTSALSADVVN
jgi:hypothetical protein